MRVFIAGAGGAIGRRLVPQFAAHGHHVVASTTRAGKVPGLEALGAEAIVMDGLDAASVGDAVARAMPDVIVHQMTALAGIADLKHFDETFAVTNALRTKGTDHLLAAAEAVGVRRFVVQSYAGWPSGRDGGAVDDGGGSTGSQSAKAPVTVTRGDPPPRVRGVERSARGNRPSLRELLRSGRLREARRGRPRAQAADRRQRRRCLVVDSRRRCRVRDRCGRRARRSWEVQCRRRRACAGLGVASLPRAEPRSEAAAAGPRLAGAARGRRGRCLDDDPRPRAPRMRRRSESSAGSPAGPGGRASARGSPISRCPRRRS